MRNGISTSLISVVTPATGRLIDSDPLAFASWVLFDDANTLSPLVTSTRTTSGTYFDANGVLQTAPANTPRVSYDPANLNLGPFLLAEEARTNLATVPDSLSVPTAADIVSDVANNVAGQQVADLLLDRATSSEHYASCESMAFVAGQTYTARAVFERPSSGLIPFFYLRAVTVASAYVFVRTSDMSVHLTAGPNVVSSEIAALPGGRWVVKLVFTAASSGTAAVRVGLADFVTLGAYTGSVRGIIVSGREVALGNVPITSPIVYGTRSADNLSVTNLAATGFNAAGSTLYLKGDLFEPLSAGRVLIGVRDASDAFGTGAYVSRESTSYQLGPSSAPLSINSVVITASASVSVAAVLRQNDSRLAVNGALGGLDQSCEVVANPTALCLGNRVWSGNGNAMNGRIYQAAIIPRRISDAALQNVTKL